MSEKIVFTERLTTFYKYPSVCLFQDQLENPEDFLAPLKTPSTRKRPQMIYLHIPFCTSTCLYCPFYKVKYQKQEPGLIERFVDCMVLELVKYSREPFFQDVPIINVQFGGGSPLTLETRSLEKIISTITAHFNLDKNAVISLEGGPLNLQDKEKLSALKNMGMTRVSFGIQTFNEKLRKKLGIETNLRDVYRAVDTIKKFDFQEFACDLLYNLPDQNANEIRFNIDRACEFEPSAIDFYDLNVFPNTRFHQLIEKNAFKTKPSNKNEILHFKAGMETFKANGFEQIRSYVFQPTNRGEPAPSSVLCSFNSDLLAVGPSGRTTIYSNGLNYRNHCSLEKYIDSLEKNEYPVEAGNLITPEVLQERDLILFPYFLKAKKELIDHPRFKDKLNDLNVSGYIQERDGVIELTDLGKMWAGNVSYYLHSDYEKERIGNTVFSCLLEERNIFNQDKMNC